MLKSIIKFVITIYKRLQDLKAELIGKQLCFLHVRYGNIAYDYENIYLTQKICCDTIFVSLFHFSEILIMLRIITRVISHFSYCIVIASLSKRNHCITRLTNIYLKRNQ